MTTRGIRNNNPGNIDEGSPWQGLASLSEMTVDQRRENRFCVFKAPVWGIRAIARVLITYQDKHKITTVKGIIDRWAPPVENNTDAYVQAVCKSIGVKPNDAINVHEYSCMMPLVKAIIYHENGKNPYTQDVIDEGLMLAGVVQEVEEVDEEAKRSFLYRILRTVTGQ